MENIKFPHHFSLFLVTSFLNSPLNAI